MVPTLSKWKISKKYLVFYLEKKVNILKEDFEKNKNFEESNKKYCKKRKFSEKVKKENEIFEKKNVWKLPKYDVFARTGKFP